ncbi:TetR/AcrR family transcriptional regulator [Williamsia sp. CHRR-6]|uniref:TetR/AcrR family transcriptional regulator n=1 Tax=Williamsia sp. CHRR-6 TaxID=2835871 RepID=UPI001BD9134D|nr:TetR/AcrR family transcriptional regulator [Williamsia sp. CHRR-6]MBT0565190.1 TetR/AcrR family transcriptional regulator [Williamsia sp. CHRR-6]
MPTGHSREPGEDARVARTRADVARAALDVLVRRGWEEVTHSVVARAAGYSKTTLYTHWPSRVDLIAMALTAVDSIPHAAPTGDLKVDLAAELRAMRAGTVERNLGRVYVALAQWGADHEEIADIRRRLVADQESRLRSMLSEVSAAAAVDAAVAMLTGAVIWPILMHGLVPGDHVIDAAVSLVLAGVDTHR